MQKILVTTDFSTNSTAGFRFAIQLASQHKYELTFLHCYHIIKPISWSIAKADAYEKAASGKIQIKLDLFVDKIYKKQNIVPENIKCVVKSSVMIDASIREYACQNNFSYICIGTRGAGKFQRIFGTNTSNLINFSDVPVIAVPISYRAKKIMNIIYASDFINLEKELKKVVDFSKSLHAKVELLHFISPEEKSTNSKIIEMAVKTLSKYDVKLQLEKPKSIESLISNLQSAIKKSKPSMVIMFTQQNRTFFEKLFLSSKSAGYSFDIKVPLLVFSKL